ncbi:meiosis-specific coiled-coil domain-containing protein MEIOC-like isoform X2 [Ambystoma mexicanum]
MDTQIFSPLIGGIASPSPSLESSRLYSNWSACGDDVTVPAVIQECAKKRAPVNLSYSGNGPDMFGLVSSILEEPNKLEPVTDWNSLSRLFPPVWATESGSNEDYHVGPQNNIMDQNEFTSVTGTQCYQHEYRQMAPEIESLHNEFEGLNLVESWFSLPENCIEQPNEAFKALPETSAFNTHALHQEGVPFQNVGFSRHLGDFDKVKLNDYERNGPDFKAYASPNRIKDNIHFQKDYWKTDKVSGKFMKNDLKDQIKTLQKPSYNVGNMWGRPFQEKQSFSKRYDDFSALKSPSSVHQAPYEINQLFAKESSYSGSVNRRPHGDGTQNGQGGYSSGGTYEHIENKPQLSPKGFHNAPACDGSVNAVLPNGNSSSYKEHVWMDGKALNPTSTTNAVYRKPKHAATSPPPSSGVSTMSSGSPIHQPSAPSSYFSQTTSPVPTVRNDGRIQVQNEVSHTIGFSNFLTESHKPSKVVRQTHVDSSTNWEDQYRKMPVSFASNWSPPRISVNEDSERFNRLGRKQNLDNNSNKDERRGKRNWNPQPGYVGQNRQVFRKKQDQNGGNMSDFINPSFLPSFPMSDFKQPPNFPPFNPHAFPPANNFPFPPSPFAFSELIDLFHCDDFNHLNPFINDLFCGDIAAPYFPFPTPFNKYRPPRNRSGPANELHNQLEECYEQWRCLEKERKKTEADLARNFPGRRVSSSNNTPISRLPANPSRVDRLIVDQFREQARVVTLVAKMERLRGSSLHGNILLTLEHHLEAIHVTQARRKDEIVNAANRQRQGAPRYNNEKDVLALAFAIKELVVSTRKTRTALWCALQMTLPKTSLSTPVKQEDVERALQELCLGWALEGNPLESSAVRIHSERDKQNHDEQARQCIDARIHA